MNEENTKLNEENEIHSLCENYSSFLHENISDSRSNSNKDNTNIENNDNNTDKDYNNNNQTTSKSLSWKKMQISSAMTLNSL